MNYRYQKVLLRVRSKAQTLNTIRGRKYAPIGTYLPSHQCGIRKRGIKIRGIRITQSCRGIVKTLNVYANYFSARVVCRLQVNVATSDWAVHCTVRDHLQDVGG